MGLVGWVLVRSGGYDWRHSMVSQDAASLVIKAFLWAIRLATMVGAFDGDVTVGHLCVK
jgi:hypothetical protein